MGTVPRRPCLPQIATAIWPQAMPACSSTPTLRSTTEPRCWCDWEEAIVSVESGGDPNPGYDDPDFRLGFARLVTHYFSHAAWLAEDELLAHADRLAGIPGVLIHGRLDIGGPLCTAWQLAQSWPGSELVVLDAAGHTSTSLGDQVVVATDAFANRQRMRLTKRQTAPAA